MDDRISELPIPICHHILCFLTQKEAARTCLLSTKWRHMGLTRPNLELSEEWCDNKQEKFVSIKRILSLLSRPWRHKGSTRPNLGSTQQNFVSVLDRTLQGYLDQNLSIHKLHLHFSTTPLSPPVISLLNKWIPMITALNIKVLKFNFHSPTCNLSPTPAYYESLEELHLCKCRLSPVKSVRFKFLHTLTLEQVKVDGATFETKTLGCPLLRRLVLRSCRELRNIRLTSPGLKHFVLCDYVGIEGRSIEIDVPNIETVNIEGPWILSHRKSALLFSRLTSLGLYYMILSSESFDLLSFRCPTLVSLTLYNCSGFKEFRLANDSVKYLRISTIDNLLKGVTICAPNIVRFGFTAHIPQVPDTFSITTTTSNEWDSNVFLYSWAGPYFDVNWWFFKLRRMLKALSGSRISLSLQMDGRPLNVPSSSYFLGDEPPVVVRDLGFDTFKWRSASWFREFTNGLFRVCRPSHVYGCWLASRSPWKYRLSALQLNILHIANKKGRTEHYFWRHDLEQVFVETLDGQQWQLMQWKKLGKLRKRKQDGIIRLRLKWRC